MKWGAERVRPLIIAGLGGTVNVRQHHRGLGGTVSRLPLTRELSAKLTEGETYNILSLTGINNNHLQFLSFRQKSKIFATSLVRGRQGSEVASAMNCLRL